MIGLDWPVGHHHQVVAGIQRYAQQCGHWDSLLDPYADLLLRDHRRAGIDGIVARATPQLARLARRAGVPVVNVWLNSPEQGLPGVYHDLAECGRMTARHLLARGFRAFGFLGFKDHRGNRQQIDGFHEVVAGHGQTIDTCLVEHGFDRDPARWLRFGKQMARWIDRWPARIGVMVANDLLCRYLAEICRARGRLIPSQVALVGTGNEVLVDTAADPALSSIDLGFERIGHRAAQLLDALMDGAAAPAEPLLLPPVSLVVRRSSDALVVDDPLVAAALRHIDEHLHEDLAIDRVAAQVATSRRTLSRRFNETLGMTIHAAITRRRLDRVKRLLVETSDPLKSIAHAAGFSDAIHLCRVFRRVEGATPSDFRSVRTTGDVPDSRS